MAQHKKANRSWDKRGKDHHGPWDTIVIGSGMGSMTAAALLADAGERVLVLEQHYTPGGFTHTFKRPGGYEWDVGVHAIGEVTSHAMTGRLLEKLTRGQLKWSSLGPVYDAFSFPDGLKIDFPDNPHTFRDNLVEAFPNGEKAIGEYFDAVREVSGAMRRYYATRALPHSKIGDRLINRTVNRNVAKYFEQTADQVLCRMSDDPKLRAVLCAQWGYYGATPEKASFAIQALVAKHFMWGAYYPDGGSARIAETLLKTVADAGGWTRISTPVDELLVEQNAVVGVRCGEEHIRAKRVISGIGAQATVQRLLPQSFQQSRWAKSFKPLKPAAAHVCLYLGFKGDIKSAGATAANQWFHQTWDQSIDAWHVAPDMDKLPDAPILYCSFPSLKDPHHDPGPELKHTGEVVTFVPWSVFEPWMGSRWKKRQDDYEAFKARLEAHLLEQFFKCMPQLAQHLEFVEFSTPLTTAHFDRAIGGSIYGLSPTPDRYTNQWLRPKAPIQNLYMAGCDVCSPGVIGAMFGGVLAALAAKPMDVGRQLKEVL